MSSNNEFPLPWSPSASEPWVLMAANGRRVADFVAWNDRQGSLAVAEQHCRRVADLANSTTGQLEMFEQPPAGPQRVDFEMNDLRVMQQLVVQWADGAFPNRAPAGALLKLYEEIGELIRAPDSAEEYADIFIMLVDLAHMYGVFDIGAAVWAKMKINSRRKWTPTAIGTMQHVGG